MMFISPEHEELLVCGHEKHAYGQTVEDCEHFEYEPGTDAEEPAKTEW